MTHIFMYLLSFIHLAAAHRQALGDRRHASAEAKAAEIQGGGR
jgi:hypothetical protein